MRIASAPNFVLLALLIGFPGLGLCASPPSKFSSLFPKGTGVHSWTTSTDIKSPKPLPLSDSTLRVTHNGAAHSYGTAPDGKKALIAHFSKGSYDYKGPPGGFSFYSPGPSSVDLTTAKEVTFGYSAYFSNGFAFNMGGKLPGLCEYRSAFREAY